MSLNTRAQVVQVLKQVLIRHESLTPQLMKLRKTQEPGLAQALCFGVLRFYWQLEVIINELCDKKPKDKLVYLLILLGLFELIHLNTPGYAVVSETVKAVDKLKRNRSKGFVNAVLRNFLRQQATFLNLAEQNELSRYNHPEWLLTILQTAWPQDWQAIVKANNQQPPMSLRINQQKVSRDDYLTRLAEIGLMADKSDVSPVGLTLKEPCAVEKLPGFKQGECFIQDIAAQLAPILLELKPAQSVLDACAAPGGKATGILEWEPTARLVAVDSVPSRIEMIQDNLTRLQLTAEVVCADILSTETWWDGQQFDRILLDAPCSATGVIRRHPDIKHLRREEDIQPLVRTQLMMLQTLWPLLKPGGLLLYATCSVLPQENTAIIKHFLQQEASARHEVIQAQWGKACQYGRQIFPDEASMDGFYYCVLKKGKEG